MVLTTYVLLPDAREAPGSMLSLDMKIRRAVGDDRPAARWLNRMSGHHPYFDTVNPLPPDDVLRLIREADFHYPLLVGWRGSGDARWSYQVVMA